jgi:tetratricopeptide (TPR) repeat protein
MQWVLEKDRWWLERPLWIRYYTQSKDAFPTQAQDMAAMGFTAAVEALDRLGLRGTEDIALAGKPNPGSAAELYTELERLHKQEGGAKGVDKRSRGVRLLLKAAGRKKGGFLKLYHSDFKSGPHDLRRPAPWDMFRDYVEAAVKLGRSYERRGNAEKAEKIYRRIISLGRQILDEPGGFHFVSWGIAFQKLGAERLERLYVATGNPAVSEVRTFINLASRRLDLVTTALGCLE